MKSVFLVTRLISVLKTHSGIGETNVKVTELLVSSCQDDLNRILSQLFLIQCYNTVYPSLLVTAGHTEYLSLRRINASLRESSYLGNDFFPIGKEPFKIPFQYGTSFFQNLSQLTATLWKK